MVESPIQLSNAIIYQGKIPVLSGVNIQLQPGEFAYLVGRTGSGKSSLLKTLYGELTLTEGSGHVAGFDLINLKPKTVPHLRRSLGIVFQDFQLLSDRNVIENLLFVLRATGWKDKSTMIERAHEVLKKVNLSTKDYKIPAELSGGEQQRLVIARALLNNPKVILADEPTGNLDPEISDEVMALLHSIASEGTCVLMATHDYRLIDKFGGSIYRVADHKVERIQSL
ncbi:MAG: ATP-binding cassette domain-containing protein [Bacteroidetes bacterium]|nr:ATP-binding cassette domain-containing protein [Bacteroidota bacterium]MDA0943807.1 ATP-binding cassette domain-containing protein [Bacteroidota bacterium]MDA1111118.1 ATP-binding cassette domain-containing protein [Bacteroidota bacterium]